MRVGTVGTGAAPDAPAKAADSKVSDAGGSRRPTKVERAPPNAGFRRPAWALWIPCRCLGLLPPSRAALANPDRSGVGQFTQGYVKRDASFSDKRGASEFGLVALIIANSATNAPDEPWGEILNELSRKMVDGESNTIAGIAWSQTEARSNEQ